MISDLLEYHMTEVNDEVKKTASNEAEDNAANAEDEDEKQQEEEKKQEKTLYDIHFVYRTVEKKLMPQPQNYIANSFGFQDKIGDGVRAYLHIFYDPNIDSGTVTIRNGKNVYKII